MQVENTQEAFGPRKLNFSDIFINTIGAFIAGIIGSIVIFFIVFLVSGFINIPEAFNATKKGLQSNNIFPFILSLIAFLGSSISIFSTYFFLTKTDPNKYKSLNIIYGQLAFFMIITYIFITPLYIYTGASDYTNVMYVFIMHTMILFFGTYLISELLNNHRYILTGLYGSFVGLFLTFFISVSFFLLFSAGFAKLLSLLLLLPIMNSLILFFKQVFELLYYHYYNYTGLDQLGDIFYQLEQEEKEELLEAESLNN